MMHAHCRCPDCFEELAERNRELVKRLNSYEEVKANIENLHLHDTQRSGPTEAVDGLSVTSRLLIAANTIESLRSQLNSETKMAQQFHEERDTAKMERDTARKERDRADPAHLDALSALEAVRHTLGALYRPADSVATNVSRVIMSLREAEKKPRCGAGMHWVLVPPDESKGEQYGQSLSRNDVASRVIDLMKERGHMTKERDNAVNALVRFKQERDTLEKKLGRTVNNLRAVNENRAFAVGQLTRERDTANRVAGTMETRAIRAEKTLAEARDDGTALAKDLAEAQRRLRVASSFGYGTQPSWWTPAVVTLEHPSLTEPTLSLRARFRTKGWEKDLVIPEQKPPSHYTVPLPWGTIGDDNIRYGTMDFHCCWGKIEDGHLVYEAR
jgi:hypothetical protein